MLSDRFEELAVFDMASLGLLGGIGRGARSGALSENGYGR